MGSGFWAESGCVVPTPFPRSSVGLLRCSRPSKNQPIGLLGRREATIAPTIVLETTPRRKVKSRGPVPVSTVNATTQVTKTTVRAHSDQASQEAARKLIPPMPRPYSLAPSVTTPLYSITVS